mmetsp:Transcript_70715/g.97996  ORF Transcript_70715/g.97996 Transcript_70715/m.97996 type:complete len:83 (+) Transcript_70715:224-472(+)
MQSRPNKNSNEIIKRNKAFLWAFGNNETRSLAVTTYPDVLMPDLVQGVPTDDPIIALSSGEQHTGIVTESGKVYMCGSNITY